jgi:drug/metabolite transporter (DMT)-like permease
MGWRTIALTALALVAFAGNSILCRMALKADLIDPLAFTQLRFLAGALALAPFLLLRIARDRTRPKLAWRPAAALLLYAPTFSLAYVALDAGAGALILFGTVQIVMIGLGAAAGARPSALEWAGLAIAFAGLVYLASPGLSAPPLGPAVLMAAAGVGWGLYSHFGRGSADPVGATAMNFALVVPPLALLLLVPGLWSDATPAGLALAIASGAVTSGLGYVIWYAALRGLTAASASIVQLSVPVIAALGGVALLDESLTPRLAAATVLVLGGVGLALRPRLSA